MKQSPLLSAMLLGFFVASFNTQTAVAKRIEAPEVDPNSVPYKKVEKPPGDLWVMSQETDSGNQYTVCITKDAMKFNSGPFVVMAKAPEWKVHVLNMRAREFWVTPLDEFNGLSKVPKYNVKKLSAAAAKAKTTADLKVAKQPVTVKEGDCQLSDAEIKIVGFTPAKLRVLATNKVPAPPQALKILGKVVGIEGLEGVPLEVKALKSDGSTVDCLKTVWCLNREQDKMMFEVPKKFSKGTSLSEVENQNTVVTLRSQVKKHLKPH